MICYDKNNLQYCKNINTSLVLSPFSLQQYFQEWEPGSIDVASQQHPPVPRDDHPPVTGRDPPGPRHPLQGTDAAAECDGEHLPPPAPPLRLREAKVSTSMVYN